MSSPVDGAKVLLVLSGLLHPPYRGRSILKQALAELPQFSFDEVSSLPEAVARELSGYRAVVLYYHHKDERLSDADLAGFRDFVHGGGGVLAVHSATASYKPCAGYFEILGGRFKDHGPVESIHIRPALDDDPVFGPIADFTVTDELYVHELRGDVRVHFQTTFRGEPVPMVWTREAEAGRVCYLCPGHRAASLQHPAVQEIARRGLEWVCRTPRLPA